MEWGEEVEGEVGEEELMVGVTRWLYGVFPEVGEEGSRVYPPGYREQGEVGPPPWPHLATTSTR